jgi:hypothetical protein
MSSPEYSKIINQVAQKIFRPFEVYRKGQSRTWLDDQNWFTTIIEFQPFNNTMGTCLNVGVNFHWYPKNYWSFDIGYRESQFIEFEDTNQFFSEVEKLAKLALEKTLNYRELLKDYTTAKQTIIKHQFASDNLWGNYHKGTICGLIQDKVGLNDYYDKLLNDETDAPWIKDLKLLVKELKGASVDIDIYKTTIFEIIRNTRKLKQLKDLEFN